MQIHPTDDQLRSIWAGLKHDPSTFETERDWLTKVWEDAVRNALHIGLPAALTREVDQMLAPNIDGLTYKGPPAEKAD